jgi:DNA-directed RNA polymerase specialized sigma24 family protein
MAPFYLASLAEQRPVQRHLDPAAEGQYRSGPVSGCDRMRKADLDLVVARLRSAEAAYEEARRQRDEAVVEMSRVDGLSNREIARRVELTAERVAQILKKGG